MKNLEKIGTKIQFFQIGTGTKGIQATNSWTSEDINNPVYSKKKPLSIEQQKQVFIKDRQNQGAKHFDKGMRIGFGLLRLHPTLGIGMNLIDMVKAGKNKDEKSYVSNSLGAASKSTYAASKIPFRGTARAARPINRAFGRGFLGGAGILMGAQDYYDDIKSLYNTINE